MNSKIKWSKFEGCILRAIKIAFEHEEKNKKIVRIHATIKNTDLMHGQCKSDTIVKCNNLLLIGKRDQNYIAPDKQCCSHKPVLSCTVL